MPKIYRATMGTQIIRSYEFPNATIRLLASGQWREFPKWCPCISVQRPRRYVAQALLELRRHRKFLVSVKKIPRAEIQTTEIEYQASKAGVIELLNKLERGEV